MDFTSERFVPHVEGDTHLEHMHRYRSARRLAYDKRVLDIACGEGYGSALLAEAAAAVVGVDIDEASITHAQQNYTRSNLRFLRGDAVALPLGDASVDLVVSFETIEHLRDHRRMMLEIKRVLAPGGVLLLSSPDRRESSDVPRNKHPFHLRELYPSELHALLAEHFCDHALYGQRVHYVSVLAPVDGRAASFIGYRDDADGGVVEGTGLPNPVYLVAVASDAPLPELPVGVFIPSQPPYTRDIALLGTELKAQKRLVAEAVLRETSLHNELDQRGQRIDELAVQLCQSDGDSEGLRQHVQALEAHSGELERELSARSAEADGLRQHVQVLEAHSGQLERGLSARSAEADGLRQHVQALEAHSGELERGLSARSAEADGLRQHVQALEAHSGELERGLSARSAEVDGLRQHVQALEAHTRELEQCRILMQGEIDRLRQRVDELAMLLQESTAEVEGLQQQLAAQRREAARLVDALRTSWSWRATAPLRTLGLGLRRGKRGCYLGAALASRFAYRALPMPIGLKLRLKHRLFERMGSTFATTGAYARWQEALRQQEAAAGESDRLAIALPSAELPTPPF